MTRGMATAAQEMGFDEFMSYDPSGGGGGGGFFKWRDQNKGTAIVWLHAKRAVIAYPLHNWPRIVEVKDKDTGEKEQRVFSDRWGCLERQVVIENQYFRDKFSAERKHPPDVCPQCLFAEYCFRQIHHKGWKPTRPVLRFEGSRDAETLVLTAGGICGWFTPKRFEQDPGLAREVKMARLDRSELWKQKLLTQKKFLFTVVDDANTGSGLQTCFEGVSLTKAVQKAINDEKTKLQRLRKDVTLANPAVHPYRFEWSFDSEQDINAMYACVALRDDEAPPDDVMELLTGPAPDVAHLIAHGDCFALRAQMEAHLCEGIEVPWDEIFGPAEAKGLMKPPEESRADEAGDGADDEDPGAFFDRQAASRAIAEVSSAVVRGEEVSRAKPEIERAVLQKLRAHDVGSAAEPSIEYAEAGLIDVVRIEQDSAVWKQAAGKGAVKLPDVKGAEVLLDAPDGTPDTVVDKLSGLLRKAGATAVGELVPCEHCNREMSTLDTECKGCGAQVDDQGNLVSRPCLKCKTQIQMNNEGERGPEGGMRMICPNAKCGAIHDECTARDPVWILVEPEIPAAPAPRRGRRGTSTSAPPFART